MPTKDCSPDLLAYETWKPEGCPVPLPGDLSVEDVACMMIALLPPGDAFKPDQIGPFFEAIAEVMFELAGPALHELYLHLDSTTSPFPIEWLERYGLYPSPCFEMPCHDPALNDDFFRLILGFYEQLKLGRVANYCFFNDIASAFGYELDITGSGLVGVTDLCEFYVAGTGYDAENIGIVPCQTGEDLPETVEGKVGETDLCNFFVGNDTIRVNSLGERPQDTGTGGCGALGYTHSECQPLRESVFVKITQTGTPLEIENKAVECLTVNSALRWSVDVETLKCILELFTPWQIRMCFVES